MKTHRRQRREGTVLALTVFMLVGMFAVLAFAVDLGYLSVVRTELQRTADAAAIAAAWDLVDEDALTGEDCEWYTQYEVRQRACQYAALNKVA